MVNCPAHSQLVAMFICSIAISKQSTLGQMVKYYVIVFYAEILTINL